MLVFFTSLSLSSCAPKPQHACGNKRQKMQKHRAMKSGREPGGAMLSR